MNKPSPNQPAADVPEIMTIGQVAVYLQLNKQVVYRHVRKGNIPVSRIGATLRFKKSIIDRWLADSALSSLRSAPPGAGTASPGEPSTFDLSVD